MVYDKRFTNPKRRYSLGVGKMLGIGATYDNLLYWLNDNSFNNDLDALKSDWEIVGNDFYKKMLLSYQDESITEKLSPIQKQRIEFAIKDLHKEQQRRKKIIKEAQDKAAGLFGIGLLVVLLILLFSITKKK